MAVRIVPKLIEANTKLVWEVKREEVVRRNLNFPIKPGLTFFYTTKSELVFIFVLVCRQNLN